MGDSSDVCPSADPNLTSEGSRINQALMLKQASMQTPGYNKYEVEKKWLSALHISDVDKIYPDPKGPNAVPPPPNPKLQIEQLKAETKKADMELRMKLGLLKMMGDAELNQAKIKKLEAEAVAVMAGIQNEQTKTKVHEINAAIAAAKERREATVASIEMMQSILEGSSKDQPEASAMPMEGQQPMEGMPPAM